ncbi:hypothetical protein PAPYR_7429 [Paratrimastix pyriformis]|uniref:Uncharacterized protein n=1 Tax=Paratrimastix pyriformis TaxID=342808 RepID=A0ABQ8UD02_9EUKA|nr:hypothetical protein PAPYR_7429 [Paratrimastix pyriformis]
MFVRAQVVAPTRELQLRAWNAANWMFLTSFALKAAAMVLGFFLWGYGGLFLYAISTSFSSIANRRLAVICYGKNLGLRLLVILTDSANFGVFIYFWVRALLGSANFGIMTYFLVLSLLDLTYYSMALILLAATKKQMIPAGERAPLIGAPQVVFAGPGQQPVQQPVQQPLVFQPQYIAQPGATFAAAPQQPQPQYGAPPPYAMPMPMPMSMPMGGAPPQYMPSAPSAPSAPAAGSARFQYQALPSQEQLPFVSPSAPTL